MRDVSIVYEDNHLLIAVKPPNMPAQADASGDMDLLTYLKAYVRAKYHKPGAVYLGLVHRLDRPVGGLMAFARTSKAAARLSAQLRDRSMHRAYIAVARGDAAPTARLVDYLCKDTATNIVRVVPQEAENAQFAALSYRRIAQAQTDDGMLSLLEITLETGRSHQIRVQLAHAGLPLWGDARYGNGVPGQQIALWGNTLTLEHPTLHTHLALNAPPPAGIAPWCLFPAQNFDAEQEIPRPCRIERIGNFGTNDP